jgi:hypothetical protein
MVSTKIRHLERGHDKTSNKTLFVCKILVSREDKFRLSPSNQTPQKDRISQISKTNGVANYGVRRRNACSLKYS